MSIGLRRFAIALLAGVATSASPAPTKTLHPDFALLDANGVNVLKSAKAVSTMKSCGQCHDTGYNFMGWLW